MTAHVENPARHHGHEEDKHDDSLLFTLTWSTSGVLIGLIVLNATGVLRMMFDTGMEWIAQWIPFLLFGYLLLQLISSAQRQSDKFAQFIADNALALVALIGTVVCMLYPSFNATKEEFNINLYLLFVDLIDLGYGVYIALRIAYAGKEREESRNH